MRVAILMAVATAFAAVSLAGPAMAAGKKKAAPGKCGTMMYYDMKKKGCADASTKK